ncbi:MAG: 50S ribosomal protein L24 [Anaerolineae bacterium]
MSKWIKKGDKVVVIAGNDRGKIGEVLGRKDDRVIVQGINIRKKHAKRKTRVGSSEILEFEAPIHISNVSICNPDGKPVKLKVRFTDQGKKELFYVDGGKDVLFRGLKKTT